MSVVVRAAAGAAIASLVLATSATAGVVLSDNFDAGTAQLNWAGDSTFVSFPGPGNVSGSPSVDLVGPGSYQFLADSGNSVDLDGSTGNGFSPAGGLQSVASLPTGNYTVTFDLAGNLRGASNQTTVVSIGDQSYTVTPSSNAQGYTTYSHTFTGASGKVAFTDLGPADQQGDLLDNVVVSTASSAPEPISWALMLLGVAGAGSVLRSQRRRTTAAI